MQKIILASQSPRRRQLLEWAHIPFEVITVDTIEDYPIGLSAEKVAMHIAYNKAIAVKRLIDTNRITHSEQFPLLNTPVLAADTIVVLGDQIIGKPADRENAIHILELLSGKVHEVITGVCLLAGRKEVIFYQTTRVEFHTLSKKNIEYYIDTFKPFDKAGAYAIQEWIGVTGIKSIAGDFYNVMGLPVSRVISEVNLLES